MAGRTGWTTSYGDLMHPAIAYLEAVARQAATNHSVLM
jgi:hypothetical protein